MAIKNILFWLLVSIFFGFSGCAKFKIRTDSEHTTPPAKSSEETHSETVETPVTYPTPASAPKIGIIFGPGGARSFAEIGFLQELHRRKIPVQAVGGVEWGGLVAAFYSLKGSLSDVEWQMAKIKQPDKMANIDELKNFLNESLSKFSVEQAKLPFACVAYHLARNQTYIMNKGPYNQLIPYCLPYPPLFKPYNSNLSAIRDLKVLAQYLRNQGGANYIILVNVLGSSGIGKNITGDKESPENYFWNEIAGFYNKPVQGVDQVVNLSLDGVSLFDFEKKRDIIKRGSESSSAWVDAFANKFGF